MRCPDCDGELVWTKYGWECLNPNCDVILVSAKRGRDWEEEAVVKRRAIVKEEKVNE